MPPWTPFDWFSQHWQQITGWSALILFFYKISPVVKGVINYFKSIEDTKAGLDLIMTNHLPHIQSELESLNTNIAGLREDTKDGFSRLADSLNVVLARIK